MTIAVLKEQEDHRVALVPATITKLLGVEGTRVLIETDAGIAASFSNESYEEVSAEVKDRTEIMEAADILVSILPPSAATLQTIKKGKWLISNFQPFNDQEVVSKLQAMGLNAFSMDMIPRTTLAQSMDVLSSMASIAGYRAVLSAAMYLPRYFPMMITAAGSIRPAKVLVLGAGVAGLQAIATARRLGASVEAFDTRQAAKEEVLSLGAKFVEVEGAQEDTGAGGYAVAQSEDFLRRQREEVQKRAIKADVIITTAQVRGRKAPLLVPESTVEAMQSGSVIVDLASSTGGNCELSEDGKIVVKHHVTIIGSSQLANEMPQDASRLYSNNLNNFLQLLLKDSKDQVQLHHEILQASCITSNQEAE